ncbi:hypothetical protein [Flavobacterium sp. UBA6031]|uniref:hypothetical protein n=1 Tax=Flavobacterium sp. UBA6031 TaxID=1946551 RepID=UPI0025BA9BF1|nr:hypothetical protein [Flavobacterium sp. UBA6031]
MKKLFFSLCLFWAIASVSAQNFVPDANKVYNIVLTNSGLAIGPSSPGGSQPALEVLDNSASQAFNFIPTGAPDTYYLLTVDNNYLNKKSTDWDANWSTIFESSVNGTSSEWVITGTDSTSIILMTNATSKYMGFDGTTAGSSLYCDKGQNNWSGTFELRVAHVDVSPKFNILGNNVVFEIEKDRQSYPMIISASNQSNNINATVSAGFSISKSTFTPTDFANGGGKIQVDLSAPSANIGDSGKVVFSYTSGGVIYNLDTAIITAVPTYERVLIRNKAGNVVIGSSASNVLKPVLDSLDAENGSEYFFLRPVHRNVSDSLYYIVQDGDYKALMKNIGSHYEVDLGQLGDSLGVWKITPYENGVNHIFNVVNQLSLGADWVGINAGIWCDKGFNLNPTASPWSEWLFVSVETALDPSSSVLSNVQLSTGFLDKSFDGATTSYDVMVPADVDTVTLTGSTQSVLSTIAINPDTLVAGTPAVLSVVSQDSTSTTNYNFNLVKITFDKWAAGGENAIPTKYGWKCANGKWAAANSTDSTSARYFDNPVDFMYNGEVGWTGRVLYLNWDGNVTASGVYSYPVSLEGGKSYKFAGKYAWVSGVSVDYTAIPVDTLISTFTFGISTALDSTGVTLASVDSVVKPTDMMKKNFQDVSLTFIPATSGTYYLTIKNSSAIKAAIADLSMSRTDGLKNVTSRNIYAYVSNDMINIHGTLAGDAVKAYNIGGQLVKQLTANSDITSINLKSGVYLIKVNANVLKVIK